MYICETEMKDYLKYLRGARKYILMEHDITLDELELLLYLKGCGRFSKEDLERFEGLLKWDKNRLAKMIQKGVVSKFRNAVAGRFKALYEVTIKGKRVCDVLYRILETGKFPDNEKSHHNKKGIIRAEQKYGFYYKKENKLRQEEALKKIRK